MTVGLISGTFDLAESNPLGTRVKSGHFGDGLDIYADWTVNEHVMISAAYSVMFPGDAAIEAFGNDEKFHLVEVGIYVNL